MDKVLLENAEIEALKNEIIMLEHRIRTLIDYITPTLSLPVEWEIPNREQQVLSFLYRANKPVTHYELHNVFCAVQGMALERNMNDSKTWESHISRLRKRLRKLELPIEIVSSRFLGYSLTNNSKVFLEQFLKTPEIDAND